MKNLTFFFSFLIASVSLIAQKFEITHGPYLCDMTQDAVTIVWTTSKPALSWVELANEGNDSFYATERPKYYETAAGRIMNHKTNHAIRITGLEPGTTYRYRIFSREVLYRGSDMKTQYGLISTSSAGNKEFTFTTFPSNSQDISFVFYNDVHERDSIMRSISKNVDFTKHDFVVFNGDMSNYMNTEDRMYKGYIDVAVELFAKNTPIMYTRGNHETRGPLSHEVINYFPTSSGEFYQLYMVGDVAFLVLDGGEDKPDSDIEYGGTAHYDAYRIKQAKWIENIVEQDKFKNARARIVILHIPPMIDDWHGNMHLRETFMPILNKANIDLMLSGHTHRYFFEPAGSSATFPTIVNDNQSIGECSITSDKIIVTLTGENGKNLRKHEFQLKK